MASKRILLLLVSLNLVLLVLVGFLLCGRTTDPVAVAALQPQSKAASEGAAAASRIAYQNVRETVVAKPQDESQPAPASAPQEATLDNSSLSPYVAWPNLNLAPVAFADPDPDDTSWTPEALDTLQSLRKGFADAVAKSINNLDPNSPGYFAGWQKIRQDFDSQFQIQFGNAAFVKYTEKQERMAQEQAAKTASP